MTTFTGTAGLDVFNGADYLADDFFLNPTTLSGGDIIAGGLSSGSGDLDTVHLGGGTYAAADFAGMSGIENIQLDGAASIEIDTAMVAQGGTGAPNSWFTVFASAGDDIIDASGAAPTGNILQIVVGGGSDTAYGGAGDDWFTVDAALGGDHTIFAGDGDDDVYIHGYGDHVLDGGAGTGDRLLLIYNADGAELDLLDTGNELVSHGGLLTASVTGFEEYWATYEDDILRGDGDDQYLWGLAGDDTLVGRGGDDDLFGDVGDDTLRGGTGNDALAGGDGIDLADYGNSGDDLDIDLERAVDQAIASGSTGIDQLQDIENVTGGSGADIIAGDAGRNVIRGGGGSDTLIGRDGDDTLIGNRGNDLLDGGTGYGGDVLIGGAGLDTADFSAATTDVFVDLFSMYGSDGFARFQTLIEMEGAIGGSADDSLYGDANSNRFEGRAGDDDMYGLDGNDQLRGGAGSDTLDGGSGDDTLIGDGGADIFRITDTGAGHGYDTIKDFQDGLDLIELYGVDNVVVNDAGADAYIDMFDAAWTYIDTVRLVGAAGQVDASDYVLIP